MNIPIYRGPAEAEASAARVRTRPDTRDDVLVARGVRKSFAIGERRIEILHGVDLEVRASESVALVGASGAGKSTLLHILGLLDEPTEGSVSIRPEGASQLVDGFALDLTERAQLRNSEIGFVFQFYHLLAELTAVENVLLPAMIAHGRSEYRRLKKDLTARATEMLVEFELEDRLKHRPPQLSGGERQRVALARSLFNEPRVVIADEPTGNLDTQTGERILKLLFDEHEKRKFSLLIVTHDERLARRCERTLFMEDGMIQADTSLPMPQ